jgi:hypothetical protein
MTCKFIPVLILATVVYACAPVAPIAPVTPAPSATATHFAEATVTFTPATPKPKKTETPTLSPTPEVNLTGLISELDKFPILTAEEELKLIALAKDTMSLDQAPDDIYHIQFSALNYLNNSSKKIGEYVRVGCNIDKSCLIRASYTIPVSTDEGTQLVHKILMELYVTHEDGTQGSVIVPIIFDMKNVDTSPDHPPDWRTRNRLTGLLESQSLGRPIDYINLVTSLTESAPTPTRPAIKALLDKTFENPRTVELLEKARELAAQGLFLTQAEIDELPDGFIWY